jgi:hypothetical protein
MLPKTESLMNFSVKMRMPNRLPWYKGSKPKSSSISSSSERNNFANSRKMGEFINFGDDVIFKHVDSEAYLSGSVRCSDGGLGSFKV